MRVISFDQASLTSGWSIFENGTYVDSGIITKSNKIPIIERVPQMAAAICEKIRGSGADTVYIEGVQTQSNQRTVIDLARLQGGIMMWCSVNNIPLYILTPTEWRKILNYRLGCKVSRAELKQQSLDYVKGHFGLEKSEDESEAICIGAAASKVVLDDDEI